MNLVGEDVIPPARCCLEAAEPPSFLTVPRRPLDYTKIHPVCILENSVLGAKQTVNMDYFQNVASLLSLWRINGLPFVNIEIETRRGKSVKYQRYNGTGDACSQQIGTLSHNDQCKRLLQESWTSNHIPFTYITLRAGISHFFCHHVICSECRKVRPDALMVTGRIDEAAAASAYPRIICKHFNQRTLEQLIQNQMAFEELAISRAESSRKRQRT